MRVQLGKPYRDIVTGFSGIVAGRCEYLTGCNQALIQPRGLEGGKMIDSVWIDEQKLVPIEDGSIESITLDNGVSPGRDAPAPPRRG